jgi:deoxyribodipyrimidine photolyase-related protein
MNMMNHRKKIDDSYWIGNTNIKPIDSIIKKIIKYSYVHHIERLMYLGNWFLFNQKDPKEVHRIFMEWTVDAYDWVMVGNIFSMSQYASNIMTKRPYFSSSNYILKMSNFKKGGWCNIWDACYYSFINKHKDILSKNYATSMQVKNYNKIF